MENNSTFLDSISFVTQKIVVYQNNKKPIIFNPKEDYVMEHRFITVFTEGEGIKNWIHYVWLVNPDYDKQKLPFYIKIEIMGSWFLNFLYSCYPIYYSTGKFITAMYTFHLGSEANSPELYQNYPLQGSNQTKSLLKPLYPLVKWK